MANQTIFEQYGFKNEQIILAVILIGYFLFLSYSTQPVPNVINNTIMYSAEETTLAPPTYVTGTQVGIGALLVIMLVLSFRFKDAKRGRVTEREFKKFLAKELIEKQTIALPDGKFELSEGDFKIDENILTIWEYRQEQRIPIQYAAQVTITERDGDENYYIFAGDPVTMMLDNIIHVDEPLQYTDKCPDCGGRFPDREVVLEKDLENYIKIKKAFSIDRS